MRTCLFCVFSGYHSMGNGLFGDLDCFRRAKQLFLAAKRKSDLFALYDKKLNERVQKIFSVQSFRGKTLLMVAPLARKNLRTLIRDHLRCLRNPDDYETTFITIANVTTKCSSTLCLKPLYQEKKREAIFFFYNLLDLVNRHQGRDLPPLP
jgi:hypothetical protein